jgi:uncharacterized membrane protein
LPKKNPPLGPIEVVTLVFPQSRFNGAVLPELMKLVENGTITIVDAVFAVRDDDGVAILELDAVPDDGAIAQLAALIQDVNGLISNDDVDELTDGLEPGSSAAILVFEHSWVLPLRTAIVASGGYMLDSTRIPGPVVDEVLAAISVDA